MIFGERLKQQRERQNLRREDIATLAGLSYSQIARYENGESQPMADAIIAIAKALSVTPDWLLGFDDETQLDDLTPLEQHALAIFRSKPVERQPTLIEVLKLF